MTLNPPHAPASATTAVRSRTTSTVICRAERRGRDETSSPVNTTTVSTANLAASISASAEQVLRDLSRLIGSRGGWARLVASV